MRELLHDLLGTPKERIRQEDGTRDAFVKSFDQIDDDDDGEVSLDEWRRAIAQADPQKVAEIAERLRALGQQKQLGEFDRGEFDRGEFGRGEFGSSQTQEDATRASSLQPGTLSGHSQELMQLQDILQNTILLSEEQRRQSGAQASQEKSLEEMKQALDLATQKISSIQSDIPSGGPPSGQQNKSDESDDTQQETININFDDGVITDRNLGHLISIVRRVMENVRKRIILENSDGFDGFDDIDSLNIDSIDLNEETALDDALGSGSNPVQNQNPRPAPAQPPAQPPAPPRPTPAPPRTPAQPPAPLAQPPAPAVPRQTPEGAPYPLSTPPSTPSRVGAPLSPVGAPPPPVRPPVGAPPPPVRPPVGAPPSPVGAPPPPPRPPVGAPPSPVGAPPPPPPPPTSPVGAPPSPRPPPAPPVGAPPPPPPPPRPPPTSLVGRSTAPQGGPPPGEKGLPSQSELVSIPQSAEGFRPGYQAITPMTARDFVRIQSQPQSLKGMPGVTGGQGAKGGRNPFTFKRKKGNRKEKKRRFAKHKHSFNLNKQKKKSKSSVKINY